MSTRRSRNGLVADRAGRWPAHRRPASGVPSPYRTASSRSGCVVDVVRVLGGADQREVGIGPAHRNFRDGCVEQLGIHAQQRRDRGGIAELGEVEHRQPQLVLCLARRQWRTGDTTADGGHVQPPATQVSDARNGPDRVRSGEQHDVDGRAEDLGLDQPRGLPLIDAVGDLDEVHPAAGDREVVGQLDEGPLDLRHRLPVGGGQPSVGEVEHHVRAGVEHDPVVTARTRPRHLRHARPDTGAAEPVDQEMDGGGLPRVHRGADHRDRARPLPGRRGRAQSEVGHVQRPPVAGPRPARSG